MAYPNPDSVKEIQARFDRPSDINDHKPLTDKQLGYLDRDFGYLLRDTGIVLGKDGKVPSTGGVPRIFVMGKTADGTEKPMSLEEAGIGQPKGRSFWDQVDLGNVFLYPAGQKDPIQLQADGSNYQPELTYSKPVAPEAMPVREMAAPSGFARFLNKISGGLFFKSVNEYDRIQNSAAERREALKSMSEKREAAMGNETAEAEEHRRELERKAHEEALKENVKKAKIKLTSMKNGYENLSSIYKPVPEKLDRLLGAGGKAGFYTQEQFNSLKVYTKDEIDLSKIALAPKGKIGPSVSEKDFVAVAMFAARQYENCKDARILGDESMAPWDPYAVNGLQQNLGLSKDVAEQLDVHQFTGMFSTDMFIYPGGRAFSGSYMKVAVNNGRQSAVDAWNAYKNGDKEPLAKIIAFGMTQAKQDLVSLVSAPGNEKMGMIQMGTHLLSIMEKDHELKDLAFRNGMTVDQVRLMEGFREYAKLNEARNKAQLKLAKAAADGTELPTAEKEACMKDIVKASLVDQIMVSENRSTSTPEMQEIEAKMTDPDKMVMIPADQTAWRKDPYKRPAPPAGKLWSDTAFGMLLYAQETVKPAAPVLGKLKDAELDTITAKIVAEDNVETLSCEELSTRYASGKLLNGLQQRSIKIAEELKAGPKEPQAAMEALRKLHKELGLESPEAMKAKQEAQRKQQEEKGPQPGGPAA